MIYLVRHGESQANVDVVFAGHHSNSPLTKKGREQAHSEGERILREEITIDRAVHTAEIIAAVIEMDPTDIKHDSRLAEYDLGELDGKSAVGVTAAQRVSAKGAEDPVVFQQRVMSCINDIEKLTGNTLLVSHDGVGRIIKATKLGIEPHRFYEVEKYPNAKIIKIG
jgi:broad specificity phosphatase PhoE